MADPCPTCRRRLTADPNDFGTDVCTKPVDHQGWRRTECFNRGLALRDMEIAALKAQRDRAQVLLIKSRDALDLAIAATQLEPEALDV